ncbi:MAG TPA: hypothetical protein VIL85_21140 [Thermomicrobiales bacterium]|jgi:hypothetical protein
MRDDDFTEATRPAFGWQQRRTGVRFYFCCCPLMLVFTPFVLVYRLVQYGTLRLLGRPANSPWDGADQPATRPATRPGPR